MKKFNGLEKFFVKKDKFFTQRVFYVDYYYTPLFLSFKYDFQLNQNQLSYLIKNSDLTQIDQFKNTAFHYLVLQEKIFLLSPNIISYLIKNTDLNHKNVYDKSVLDFIVDFKVYKKIKHSLFSKIIKKLNTEQKHKFLILLLNSKEFDFKDISIENYSLLFIKMTEFEKKFDCKTLFNQKTYQLYQQIKEDIAYFKKQKKERYIILKNIDKNLYGNSSKNLIKAIDKI